MKLEDAADRKLIDAAKAGDLSAVLARQPLLKQALMAANLGLVGGLRTAMSQMMMPLKEIVTHGCQLNRGSTTYNVSTS